MLEIHHLRSTSASSPTEREIPFRPRSAMPKSRRCSSRCAATIRPEHLVIRARPHLVQRLDHLQNPRLEVFVERPQFFQRWCATAGSACQWIAKVQPKPSPSGFPWHPAFSIHCHAACGEAAPPPALFQDQYLRVRRGLLTPVVSRERAPSKPTQTHSLVSIHASQTPSGSNPTHR